MTRWAIADTGPLVAFMDRRDDHHEWVREQFWQIEGPLLVCEPVLTEALFLLRRLPHAQDALVGEVQEGRLRVGLSLTPQLQAIRQLLRKYADVPMSLADACLVRMSELYHEHSICTLDTDFRVYRKNGREVIPVIMPPT